MGSYPSAVGQLYQPLRQQPTPQEVQAKQLELQQQQQQVQAGALSLEQQKQAQKDQQAQTKAMQEWDGKDFSQLPTLVMKHGASATTVLGMRDKILKQQQEMTTWDTAKLANAKAKIELGEKSAANILSAPEADRPIAWASERQQLLSTGAFSPQELPEQYPGDQFVAAHAKAATAEKKAIADATKAQSDAQMAGVELMQKQRTLAGTNPQGITAAQQLEENNRQRMAKLEERKFAETQRHNKETETQLSEDGLNIAADNYAKTGNMPTGMRSKEMVAKILSRAAQRNPGGIDIASNKASYDANRKSLDSLQKNFDQVTAFENTAGKNLDVFLGTAAKVVDSGSPLINLPLRKIGQAGLGSENQAAFNAARTTALTEIAKVLNSSNASGVLSDSARHEVEQLIGPDATLKQVYAAAKVLKTDMANRHESYQMQINDIKGRIGGTQKPANDFFSNFGGTAIKK